jgi:putative salt-induced outer membrane protein
MAQQHETVTGYNADEPVSADDSETAEPATPSGQADSTETGDVSTPAVDSDTTEQGSTEQSDDTEVENTVAESPPEHENGFSGEGSLGWISNNGNTNNESLNGSIKTTIRSDWWAHNFSVSAKRVRDERTVTAERYVFTEKSDFTFSDTSYAFASLRYDDDRFDGFDYQASATVGIGWYLISSDTQHFDLELGAGYRKAKLSATGEKNNEVISRLAQHYDINFTNTSQFFQDMVIESGNTNTASEFIAGLKVSMNSKLALKVSYNVKRNSDPAPGSEKTDRTTAINLVFGF